MQHACPSCRVDIAPARVRRPPVVARAAAAFVLLLGACAPTAPLRPVDPGADPASELRTLKHTIDQARVKDVHLLAPSWYARAVESYEDAVQRLSRGGGEPALRAIARAAGQLEQAGGYAARSAAELGPVVDARKGALLAGAARLYSPEFDKTDRALRELAEYVERDRVAAARAGRQEVVAAYRGLELRAIKEHTLGETRRLIDAAIAAEAARLAPKSLAAAQAALRDAERYITANPYASQGIQEKAGAALQRAQQLTAVLRQVKGWSATTTEEQLLSIEARVMGLEELVAGTEGGRRAQTLDERLSAVEHGVKALVDSQQRLGVEVTRLQMQLRQVTAETLERETRYQQQIEKRTAEEQKAARALVEEKRLREAEREFDARFERVRALFAAGEADVYRQGGELLIRLKAVNFEVGKAYLLPEHFPLLAKVQQAIRLFGARQVTVEGHTDLTGSGAVNEELSRQRAEAVAAYLVNNAVLDRASVRAVGYGPQRPVAPNNTAEGRRLNRRIDVVLIGE